MVLTKAYFSIITMITGTQILASKVGNGSLQKVRQDNCFNPQMLISKLQQIF